MKTRDADAMSTSMAMPARSPSSVSTPRAGSGVGTYSSMMYCGQWDRTCDRPRGVGGVGHSGAAHLAEALMIDEPVPKHEDRLASGHEGVGGEQLDVAPRALGVLVVPRRDDGLARGHVRGQGGDARLLVGLVDGAPI